MDKNYLKAILWVTFFAIAMGFLESAVVVYLREIYYPMGFDFPLAPIDAHIALTEVLREAATLIMLLSIGVLVGKNLSERFAWFIYSFAVWDIFYYVFLKLLVDWPESLMTWDILFLIPVTWVGPVVTPVFVSITMILFAWLILWFNMKGDKVKFNWKIWGLLIFGSLVLIVGFTWDYSSYILENFSFTEIWNMPDNQVLYDVAYRYVPRKFPWMIFILGELIIFSGILLFYLGNRNKTSN